MLRGVIAVQARAGGRWHVVDQVVVVVVEEDVVLGEHDGATLVAMFLITVLSAESARATSAVLAKVMIVHLRGHYTPNVNACIRLQLRHLGGWPVRLCCAALR